jgi:fructokinase
MIKNTIFTLGKASYDITMAGYHVDTSSPGGSMLNTAVDLAHLGKPVAFIGAFGDDELGSRIRDFLIEAGVDCTFYIMTESVQTRLAISVLDANRKPSYTFYGENYPIRTMPEVFFRKGDFLLYGASFVLSDSNFKKILSFLHAAKTASVMLVYDPNIRNPAKSLKKDIKKRVDVLMGMADVIKLSDEDLTGLDLTFEQLQEKFPDKPVILTRGADAVRLAYGNLQLSLDVPQTEVVNTIGAGDAFNAGLLAGLLDREILSDSLQQLSQIQWRQILWEAVSLAAKSCQQNHNFIPETNNRI